MFLDLKTIANQCNGQLFDDKDGIVVTKGVSIDSRTLKNGQLFFAIRGDKADGHDYLKAAADNGAVGAVVEKHQDDCKLAQIVVDDSISALQQSAKQWRQLLSAKIIMITGSNGKTTVKEMLNNIFSNAHSNHLVHCSKGNFNNHLGLPLTLLQATFKHRYIITEAGMNHPGELKLLSQMTAPNAVVINNAQRAHIGNFTSLKAVAEAKGEILEGLPMNGMAILNVDDPYYSLWKELAGDKKIVPFGTSSKNTEHDFINIKNGHLYLCNYRIDLPLLGQHNVMNAATAAAVAYAFKISSHHIIKGLKQMTAVDGRLKPHPLNNGSMLIDDSYNANPDSANAAVDTLFQMTQKSNHKPIYVLADMQELGEKADNYHEEIINHIVSNEITVIGFGKIMKKAMIATNTADNYFKSKKAMNQFLENEMKDAACCILVKGSRELAMDDLVKTILKKYIS